MTVWNDSPKVATAAARERPNNSRRTEASSIPTPQQPQTEHNHKHQLSISEMHGELEALYGQMLVKNNELNKVRDGQQHQQPSNHPQQNRRGFQKGQGGKEGMDQN